MGNKKIYNGVIDWWKLVFCTVILIMHVGEFFNEGFYLFEHGGYAVEFFFIVSGYFMCAHAMKQEPSGGLRNIGRENIKFISGKIETVLPAYIYAWLLAFAMYIYKTGIDVLKNDGVRAFALKIVYALPNLLLLDMGGIKGTEILGVSWYVSAMLIVMFITYPMLRKWGRNYCLIAAPLIALLKDKTDPGGVKRTLICMAEPAAYISALALMHFGDDRALNIINILLLIGVSVTMSGRSFFASICDNGVCRFMGRLSLWVYFCQSPARMFVLKRFPDCSYKRAFVLIFGLTALLTAVGMGMHALISKRKNGGKI